MDALTPTTELEAVNEMLNAISESAVESLDEGNADVAETLRLLRTNARRVQTSGWWFNTELYTLTPDTNGYINLPTNILKVRLQKPYQNLNYVVRGTRMYDKDNNTFIFPASTKLEVEVILGLTFDQLPESARDYVTAVAGYEFCDTSMGAEPNRIFTRERMQQAQALMLREEVDSSKPNMIYDSYYGALLMNRRVLY